MFTGPADILLIPLAMVMAFLIWAALSPFETLGWWAGWFGDKIYNDNIPADGPVRCPHPDAKAFVLFLSGIGRVSGYTYSFREQEFLRLLAVDLPQAVVIDDIFPYSVNNLALTRQPVFARLWQWALARKRTGPALLGYLINVRNLFQVGIAVDRRYAPMYNQGVAEIFLDTLLRYGYDPQSDSPVYVIGYSGAAQMAVGAVTYLREWIAAPIYVISLGGIFSSDPGLLMADHVYHLVGDKDRAQIWRFLMPSRWPWYRASAWNRALRAGHVTVIPMPGMGHTGRGGYLDVKQREPTRPRYVEITTATIANIVESQAAIP
ncbi:MAG: hypothetical protein IPK16_06785 [Anaerolineales bacterium]|nr:hypothetical protein [Anaerolineales bacterium]